MADELPYLTPEQEEIVDVFIDLQLKMKGLIQSNREVFAIYSESQGEIKKLQEHLISAAEIADGLALKLAAIVRNSRKNNGNDF
jgi:hypothetical protein